MREQHGDRSSANWLRGLATQLATSMGSSLLSILKEAEADQALEQGIELSTRGQFTAAINILERASGYYQEIGSKRGEGQTSGNLGVVYSYLGQYLEAINYHRKSLSISREIQNLYGEATSLGNLGVAFYFLGRYEEAMQYHCQHQIVADKIGDQEGKVNALGNQGLVFYFQQEISKAVDCYEQAWKLAQDIGYQRGVLSSLSNLGATYNVTRKYEEAINYHQQALAIAQSIRDRHSEAASLSGLGIVYASLGEFGEAIRHYQQSLEITKKIGDRRGEAKDLMNIGYALLKSGRLANAEQTLQDAMKAQESLRSGLDDISKVSVFDVYSNTYCLLQQALVLQHRADEALEISERGRTRAFLELLYERFIVAPEKVNNALVKQNLVISPNIKQIKKTAQEQKITIVEYSIINSDHLFIWVVNPTGKIEFCPVYLKSLRQQDASLEGLVTNARRSLGVDIESYNISLISEDEDSFRDGRIFRPLQQLYQHLIQPIFRLLPSKPDDLVIFIPQGTLFLVPFAALQDPTGKFLVEQHTVLIAPSIQVLQLTLQQQEEVNNQVGQVGKDCLDMLVVGNPTMPMMPLTEPPRPLASLPGAAVEATAIASLFNTQPIIGAAATKVDVVERMTKARLVHLATHGLLDDIKQLGIPGAIALSPSGKDNGFLTAGEILELKLDAELVVLSACKTGLGKITGDGVVGLSRCLMSAGVRRTVVSLWEVEDLATTLLMIKLYKNLKNTPRLESGDVAKALSQAQKWLFNLTSKDAQRELLEIELFLENLRPHMETLKLYMLKSLAEKPEVFSNAKSKEFEVQRIIEKFRYFCKQTPYPFFNPRCWAAFTTVGL